MKNWKLGAMVLSMAAIAACGGSESTTGTTSGGTGGSAGTSTGAGGGAQSARHGNIDILQTPDPSVGWWASVVTAEFVDNFHVPPLDSDCTHSTISECSVYLCNDVGYGDPVHAGRLLVDGLTAANGEVTPVGPLSHDGDMQYWGSIDGGDHKTFSGGETITVKATGGQVPPFKFSATAPHLIDLKTPDFSQPIPLNSALDYPVEWMNGQDGTVVVSFDVPVDAMDGLRAGNVTCSFPASAGKGVIPAAALKMLVPTPGFNTSGIIGAWVGSQETVDVGGFSVSLTIRGAVAPMQTVEVY